MSDRRHSPPEILRSAVQIQGIWRLEAFFRESGTGKIWHPFGEAPMGYLNYGREGFMSVNFSSRQRLVTGTAVLATASDVELAEVAKTYLGYCGRYSVSEGVVEHHVEVSFTPDYVGKTLKRHVTLEGDRLTLSTPPFKWDDTQWIARLLWKRAVQFQGDPNSVASFQAGP